MPIDEELAPVRIPVAPSFDRIAEQGARIPVQRSPLGLETLTADVDDHPTAASGGAVVLLENRNRRHRFGRVVQQQQLLLAGLDGRRCQRGARGRRRCDEDDGRWDADDVDVEARRGQRTQLTAGAADHGRC